MPDSWDQNCVAEKRNKTLLDMVWNLLSSSNIPKSLMTEALNMTLYILNRIPTKVVLKISIELLKGWKLVLQHMHIWRCPSKMTNYKL